ncbi:MFS transporter [Salinispirillum sp. LH 10-3-1]|uniref:MFS transporter n=1 Tax=Salinispirillum sp. LH 10-3-1 TaxID=2952525 RepID=A0AB38YIB0_9GAMM
MQRTQLGIITLAFIAFISLGLPDGLLGVAWPSMRADFGVPLDALGILLVAFTVGYMSSSFFSGVLVRWLGIGMLLALSCAATGLALLGYTLAPGLAVVVLLGVVAGAGAGAIDAGLNTYVAEHHSPALMQWLHASFGVGITLGPIIMTFGLAQTENWRTGYWVVGAAQVLLALLFLLTASWWEAASERRAAAARDNEALRLRLTDDAGHVSIGYAEPAQEAHSKTTPLSSTLRQPKAWLSMFTFFLYTGLELTTGIWAFTLLTESRGFSIEVAGFWVAVYWGMFTVGRIAAGISANRVSSDQLIFGSLVLALLGAALLYWNPSPLLGLLALGLLGFAFAPIFPGMVSATALRVGTTHSTNTMGMQIGAAGLGSAILPATAGVLGARLGLEAIPLLVAAIAVLVMLSYSLARYGFTKA